MLRATTCEHEIDFPYNVHISECYFLCNLLRIGSVFSLAELAWTEYISDPTNDGEGPFYEVLWTGEDGTETDSTGLCAGNRPLAIDCVTDDANEDPWEMTTGDLATYSIRCLPDSGYFCVGDDCVAMKAKYLCEKGEPQNKYHVRNKFK